MSQLGLGLGAVGPPREELTAGALVLRGLALGAERQLLDDLAAVSAAAPFRHMVTPRGPMSVAMTNVGALGWVSDAAGYRYAARDPVTDRPWPALPASFRALAVGAAAEAGFAGFEPDACLVNRYAPGARMGLHQDRNEPDLTQPIVSVSLGLPATFLFGGLDRGERPRRVPVVHGDVVVWGGPARLRFHGVAPLADGHHPATGGFRVNLTFRRAGPPPGGGAGRRGRT